MPRKKKQKKQHNQFELHPIFKICALILIIYIVASDFIGNVNSPSFFQYDDAAQEANPELEVHSHEHGFVEDEDDLSIVIIKQGAGQFASCGDKVRVNIEGFLVDGTVFQSRIDKEITIGNGEVILGLEKALLSMMKGEIREVVIPAHLAFDGEKFTHEKLENNTKIAYRIGLGAIEFAQEIPALDQTSLAMNIFQKQAGTGDKIWCGSEVKLSYKSYSGNGDVLEDKQLNFTIGDQSMARAVEQAIIDARYGAKIFAVIPAKSLENYAGDKILLPENKLLLIDMEINTPQ